MITGSSNQRDQRRFWNEAKLLLPQLGGFVALRCTFYRLRFLAKGYGCFLCGDLGLLLVLLDTTGGVDQTCLPVKGWQDDTVHMDFFDR